MAETTELMIVDDDLLSLHILSGYLRDANYAFATAENGEQAWELLQSKPTTFSCVLADRIMPKMHGLTLFQKMQQQPALQKIPFILLTGEAEKSDMITALQAGVFDFLYKPVEKELLLAVLRRALKV